MQGPFLLALSCITGIHKDSMCPTQTPISPYQLTKIWNPTPGCSFIPKPNQPYPSGCYTTSKPPIDYRHYAGKKLKVAAILEPPYVTSINNGTLDGVARDVLRVLREAIGFDYEIVTPKDGVVGLYNETSGNWTGILGMLQRGEADFSVQFISQLQIRLDAFNFSRSFGEERWVIMMNRPRETTDGEGLVAPFQRDVWWCLLVSLLAMGPLAYIMVRLRCHACRHYPHLSLHYSFGHCLWFVYGALMKQGSVLKPVADSSRMLFATWWIFVTILTAFYTANLTAYLTLSKIPIPWNSLDRIGYRDYWIAKDSDTLAQAFWLKETMNDTAKNLTYYMSEVPYPGFKKLRWRLGQSNAYGIYRKNMTEMVDLVRREKYLLLEEQSRVERIIYNDFRSLSDKRTPIYLRCAFIMSKNAIMRVPYGFAFRNATIRDIFGPTLDKLTKGGIFNYWRREDLPMKDPCSADSDFRERQLRNGDLMTTYTICGLGYGLAFVTFLIEVIFKWISNRKIRGQLVPIEKTNLSFYKGNLTVPAGAPTYFDTDKFLKNINGRDYIVMKTPDGRTRLVPKNDGMQALQPVYQPPPPINYSFMS